MMVMVMMIMMMMSMAKKEKKNYLLFFQEAKKTNQSGAKRKTKKKKREAANVEVTKKCLIARVLFVRFFFVRSIYAWSVKIAGILAKRNGMGATTLVFFWVYIASGCGILMRMLNYVIKKKGSNSNSKNTPAHTHQISYRFWHFSILPVFLFLKQNKKIDFENVTNFQNDGFFPQKNMKIFCWKKQAINNYHLQYSNLHFKISVFFLSEIQISDIEYCVHDFVFSISNLHFFFRLIVWQTYTKVWSFGFPIYYTQVTSSLPFFCWW